LRRINAVFFDFDGVLIDSLPTMEIAWESVKKNFKLDVEFSDYSKYIGLPFFDILRNLNIKEELSKDVHDHYSEKSTFYRDKVKLNPYAKDILLWLKNNNFKTAIVTSKDLKRSKQLTEMFDLKIDLLITPELTRKGKPNPEPLFLAAKNLSVNLSESIFIGDMSSDMKCAEQAGCFYLHYLMGYQKLIKTSYGGNISSLREIKEFIINF